MNLINLGQKSASGVRDVEAPPDAESTAAFRAIEQLRSRIVSPDYRDSLDVKTAILGEMLFQCFRELQKRRYL